MNIDKVAAAIENDAGQKIVGLKGSLLEMQNGKTGRTYTVEQLLTADIQQNSIFVRKQRKTD